MGGFSKREPESQRRAPAPPPTGDFVTLEPSAVFAYLSSAPEGLEAGEAERRLRLHGPNEIARPQRPQLLPLFFAQVSHTLALLLWAAAALALLAGLPQLAWAIVAIVLINAAFSFWQEYRASQLVEALHGRMPSGARVRRDGNELRVPATEVVPGDVLIVHRGDRVAADVRLTHSAELLADYSILTGESQAVERTPQAAPYTSLGEATNCVLAGTTVLEGSAEGVVFATGRDTAFGKVAALTQQLYAQPSPLQREMAVTARIIAAVAICVGVVFFATGYATERVSANDGFLFGVGILVALIPEGLLPTVSLALALGVQRMGHQNAIVKRLSSVEALGSTSVICTDKTGTLTETEMAVHELWAGDALYGVGEARPPDESSGQSALTWLLRCAVLCNNGVPPSGRPSDLNVGDPLDEALLLVAMKLGLDPHRERRAWRRLKEFPFHAERRRMSTLHKSDGALALFVKGGPAETLARCVYELRNEEPLPLEEARRSQILGRVNDMSDRGLRVLGFAYRPLRSGERLDSAEEAEQELIFLGLAGLENPLRAEVPQAVARCQSAGIRVVMLTGDHEHTALVVAKQAGIASNNATVVTGGQLDALDDGALIRLLEEKRPAVFARVAPEHKLRLVQAYKRLGDVVAVTGDGVNDAPALKAADVGVAMGKKGSDVAREAADMVLMDDNFATIVAAVEEGRAVYENIRKFLTYFLTANVAEAAPFVLFVLAGIPLPLTVLQILLVDLGADVFPGLALGADPAEPGLMRRPPRARGERMVSAALLLRALAFLGMLAAVFSLAGYFYWQWDVTGTAFGSFVDEGPLYRQATTMTWAGIVACQIGNAFACRSERESILRIGFLTNRPLLWAIAATIAFMAIFIALPPLRDLFDLEPIEPRYWPILATFPFLFLAAEEARKLILRRLSGRRTR